MCSMPTTATSASEQIEVIPFGVQLSYLHSVDRCRARAAVVFERGEPKLEVVRLHVLHVLEVGDTQEGEIERGERREPEHTRVCVGRVHFVACVRMRVVTTCGVCGARARLCGADPAARGCMYIKGTRTMVVMMTWCDESCELMTRSSSF